MSGALAALVASVALAASGLRYDVGATAQLSYGTDWEAPVPFRSTQLEIVPRLGLSYGERDFDLKLTYDPHILTDAYWNFSVLHRASISFDLRARPVRLAAIANASYGTNSFRYQSVSLPSAPTVKPETTPGSAGGTEPPTPPPPSPGPTQTVQSIPLLARVTYFQANAGLGLEVRGSRNFGMNAALSYMVQGGTDAESRVAVPLQRGPTVGVGVEWRVAPGHALATILAGSYYTFPAEAPTYVGHNAWTSQLIEAWKYSFSRAGTLELGAGVGVSGNATEFPQLAVRDVTPVAEAALDLGGGLRLAAAYRPFVDYTTGISASRADANASMAIPLSASWTLVASAEAAEIVTGLQRGQITASAQVIASARLTRALRAFGGLTGLWQRAGPDYAAAELRQVSLVIGVDFGQGGRL